MDSGFPVLDSVFLDSGTDSLMLNFGLQGPGFRIHKKKFHRFQNLDYLTRGKSGGNIIDLYSRRGKMYKKSFRHQDCWHNLLFQVL